MEVGDKLRRKKLWFNTHETKIQMSKLINLRAEMTKLRIIELATSTSCEELDLEYFRAAFACWKFDNRKK